jgi:hypothetical protein
MQNEWKCPICLDLSDDNNLISAFGCKTHLLCINCNNKCIEKNIHKCPLCRARRTNNKLIEKSNDISDDDISNDGISNELNYINNNNANYWNLWGECPMSIGRSHYIRSHNEAITQRTLATSIKSFEKKTPPPTTLIFKSSFRRRSVGTNTGSVITNESFLNICANSKKNVNNKTKGICTRQINRQNKQDWKNKRK